MKKNIALNIQVVNIAILLASFAMMAQTYSQQVFIIGMIVLIVSALCQIGVGNIGQSSSLKQWLRSFFNIVMIIEQVILISLLVSPLFLKRQFVQGFLLVLIFGTLGLFTLLIIRGSRKEGQ